MSGRCELLRCDWPRSPASWWSLAVSSRFSAAVGEHQQPSVSLLLEDVSSGPKQENCFYGCSCNHVLLCRGRPRDRPVQILLRRSVAAFHWDVCPSCFPGSLLLLHFACFGSFSGTNRQPAPLASPATVPFGTSHARFRTRPGRGWRSARRPRNETKKS